MDESVVKAFKIIDDLTSQWGEKNIYHVTIEELLELRKIASSTIINRDNKDGTFYHELAVGQKKFALSTKERMENTATL
jgi:hypothetical protein